MRTFRHVKPHMRALGAAVLLGVAAAPYAHAQTAADPAISPSVSMPAVAMPQSAMAPPMQSAPVQAAPESSCNTDMGRYQQKRAAALQSINALVKGPKKQLDPMAACPKFRTLVSVETEMKNWVLKNKDWCSIPDQFVEAMSAGFAKTPQFAQKACAAAAQAKRAAAGGGFGSAQAQPAVKLPTGPL